MATKKFTKPSNKKLVFHKKTNSWISPEEESGLMALEKIKRDQARKQFEELNEAVNKVLDDEEIDDEPHSEQVMCPKCKAWTESNEPCCP